MIKHPLSAPSILGDGPSTLARRRSITPRGVLVRNAVLCFWRRGEHWLRELAWEAVFQARCQEVLS